MKCLFLNAKLISDVAENLNTWISMGTYSQVMAVGCRRNPSISMRLMIGL